MEEAVQVVGRSRRIVSDDSGRALCEARASAGACFVWQQVPADLAHTCS